MLPALAILGISLAGIAAAEGPAVSVRDGFGPRFAPAPAFHGDRNIRPHPGDDPVHRWNEIAINASGLDHTPVAPGEQRVFGEQFGPGRASRAIAIAQIAVFDATNAIEGGYQSYSRIPPVKERTSFDAAVAQAAHDTLVVLFPSQAQSFDVLLAEDLDRIRDGRPKTNGIDLGRRAAAAVLAVAATDGSQHPEPLLGIDWFTSDEPGMWRQDPISLIPLALGAHWGEVQPFVLESGRQFRVPPPPSLTSSAYATAFAEVKRLGGDGEVTPTERTADQTVTGIFWAYDGTPSLCAPPRLYNQVVLTIASQRHTRGAELARLLALANVAMSDAGIAIWESKYFYSFWRPVTGIRESDEGTGPTGAGDGNAATIGDPTFTPLGAPRSNGSGPNFTPPFPAYPSGHAGFGGALFQTLRNFYGTDRIPFSFVSDEFNGVTQDNEGNVRPLVRRHFVSFSQAEEENGQSRIYLGIHWSFDKTEGIAQGRRVANYVFRNAFAPVRHPGPHGR
jgi:hypothetical protein